jgi:hypothetical protein
MTKSVLIAAVAALLATTALTTSGASAMSMVSRQFEAQPAMFAVDDAPTRGHGSFATADFSDLPLGDTNKIGKSGSRLGGFNVTGDPQTIFGQPGGQKKGTGFAEFDDLDGGAGNVNLPGSQNGPKKTGKSAAVFGKDAGGASSLNLPGSQGSKGKAIDKADKLKAQMAAQAQALLDEANNNGVNNLNIPTQSSMGDMASKQITPEQVGQGGSQKGDGPLNTRTQEMADFLNRTADQQPSKSSASAEGSAGAAGAKTDTSNNGLVNTGLTGADHAEGKAAKAGSAPASAKKNNGSDNNPDSEITPVDASTALSPGSAPFHSVDGGGTDNNTTETGTAPDQLSPGSSYAHKGDGDGSDADNSVGTPVLLADDTSLGHYGDGDGGTSDGRGDNGHTKLGKAKPVPANTGRVATIK